MSEYLFLYKKKRYNDKYSEYFNTTMVHASRYSILSTFIAKYQNVGNALYAVSVTIYICIAFHHP